MKYYLPCAWSYNINKILPGLATSYPVLESPCIGPEEVFHYLHLTLKSQLVSTLSFHSSFYIPILNLSSKYFNSHIYVSLVKESLAMCLSSRCPKFLPFLTCWHLLKWCAPYVLFVWSHYQKYIFIYVYQRSNIVIFLLILEISILLLIVLFTIIVE